MIKFAKDPEYTVKIMLQFSIALGLGWTIVWALVRWNFDLSYLLASFATMSFLNLLGWFVGLAIIQFVLKPLLKDN